MMIGEAYIEVHADTSGLASEVQKGAVQAGTAIDSGVKQGTDKAKGHAAEAGKAIGDSGTKAGKAFGTGISQGVGQAGDAWRQVTTLVAGGAFVAGVKSAITAASDLNETISKSAQIFGQEAVPQLEEFGKAAATAMGLSEKGAIDAATGFGLLLQNTGFAKDETVGLSEKLTGLASDFASFFNTSPEDAVYAIGAAFRGETEPIRRYGIFLDDATLKQEALKQGLYDGTGVLDKNAKSHAALATILQQSTQAQGDFARTADGVANKERIVAAEAENAKAKIGAGLLPIYKEVLDVTGKLVTMFGNLPQPIQQAAIALTALTILKGPMLSLGGAISGMATSLISLGPAAAVAIGALGALYIIFSDSGTIMEDNTAVTKKYTTALKDMGAGAEKAFDDLRRAVLTTEGNTALISKLGLTVDQVAKAMAGSPGDYGKFIEAVGQAARGSDDAEKAFEALKFTLGDIKWGEQAAAATQMNLALATLGKSGVEELTSSTSISSQALAGLMQAMQDGTVSAGELSLSSGDAAKVIDILGKAMEAQGAAAKNVKAEIDPLKDAMGRAGSASEELATGLDAAAHASDLFGKSLDKLLSPTIGLEKANLALQKASDDVIATFQKSIETGGKHGKSLDEIDQKTGTLTDTAVANREAILGSVEAAEKYAEALINNGKSTDEAAGYLKAYSAGLVDQITKFTGNRVAAQAYVDQLGLTPEHVDTTIQLYNDQHAKDLVEQYIKTTEGIPKEKKTEIQALIDQGKYQEAAEALNLLGKPITVHVRPIVDASVNPNARFQPNAVTLLGGPVPGYRGEPQPILAHGGEYVLTAAEVDAIKLGRPAPDNDTTQMTAMQLVSPTRPTLQSVAGNDGATLYAPLTINGDVDKATAEELLREWQRTVLDTYAAGRRR